MYLGDLLLWSLAESAPDYLAIINVIITAECVCRALGLQTAVALGVFSFPLVSCLKNIELTFNMDNYFKKQT